MNDCPVCHQEICLCGEVLHVKRVTARRVPWYTMAWLRFSDWLARLRP